MYGDCQVLSGMGGNGMPSETLFTSQSNFPNFNFMPNLPFNGFPSVIPKEEMGMMRAGKEEIESGGSGSDHIEGVMSANEQETDQQQQQPAAKKKRYHRHTARQINEMEALFKECPHPDDKQRMRLSQELGLKPRQVKFWFQNRRTQLKAQQDRADNQVLRAENEKLKSENYRLQAALRNITCPTCGGPGMLGEMSFDEQQLRLENAHLKEEFDRVCCLASQYCGRQIQPIEHAPPIIPSHLDLDMNMFPNHFEEPMANCPNMMHVPMMPQNFHFPNSGLITEEGKPLAMEIAVSFMDELVKMCKTGEPLWVHKGEGGSGMEELNADEHAKMFPWPMSRKPQPNEFMTEATRNKAIVIMNSITLVDAFIDADKWMELFPSIISRAKTLQIVNAGVAGHANGSLQLMYAEFQVLSPLVPPRELHFLRYCQQTEEGTWAIVDFPLESFHENYSSSLPRYMRKPSGCIIQDEPNGYSTVTWVEHAEVEDEPVHSIFTHFVKSGMAFGAQRWLSVLKRQCERLASLMARNISEPREEFTVIPTPEARKNLMHLSQRMMRMFCVNISSSCGQSWTALSDSADDTIRIAIRKVTELGQPNGLILTAVSTTWLSYPLYQVFDLLRDERRRTQIDELSNGTMLHEVAHIANGSHPGNCISILRPQVSSTSSQNLELVLQESCIDDSSAMVAYTTVDINSLQLVMSSDDPSCIECTPLLPLGFVIVPVGPKTIESNNPNSPSKQRSNNGCLLTVGLQILASTDPEAKLNLSSAAAINNHICNTVHQITAALNRNSNSNIVNCTIEGGIGDSSTDEPPITPPLQQLGEQSPTP